ncbi:MAG TPA: hypothetical protein VGQ94_06965 [Terriglobales bacterium]|nr:hypothetical protein [Terriglobales bacterium]
MRRLLAMALLAALPAAAQIHGVPPSVTSITPGRNTPGVPASVTSLGPNGFGGSCCAAGFQFGARHHQHHRSVVVVPYYYYPYYASYPATYSASVEEGQPSEEEPPARTIYERRSRTEYSTDQDRYGEHYTDSREEERRRRREEERQAEEQRQREQEAQKAESKPASDEKPEVQEPPTVLVFKDGRHQDVSSYAISGEVIYDLAGGRARKILLADLDLAATIKLNDRLGNDFRIPSRPPKQN